MARHKTSRTACSHHKPKTSDVKAPTHDQRSYKGQRLNMWRESDMRGVLDEWKAGTQKSVRKLVLSWTEEHVALTASSTSTSNTEPTASAPDTELSLPSTADCSAVQHC